MAGADRQTLLENFGRIFSSICPENAVPIEIDLAFPGPFDYKNGICLLQGLDKYDALYGCNLRRAFSEISGLPEQKIQFINDAAAFALGEMTFGQATQAGRALFVAVGTGCGSAFGVNGFLAEEGTPGVPPNGYFYNAPFRDSCVDDYISRRGLEKLSGEMLGVPLDGRALAERIAAGDERAKACFWGDIMWRFPESCAELPKETICLNWGYLPHQRENEIRDIAASGITQYACPGVCGWNRWMPLMYNSYLNIRTMCHHAHKYNAIGLLNTDWGDYGHVNDPRLTIPGILYGAAFGWNAEPVEFDELNEAVSRLYYGDTTGQFAGLMAKLQDYEVFDWRNTVNWIECDEKTRAEILSEVDFTRIDDANRAVEKAKADILAAAVNLPAGKKQIVQVLCQTADIIVLWNRIGAWLNAGCPHGPEADAMAAALEHWLQRYRAQWRQVSKESSLSVLTNLICRYADLLRGRAYGTVEAPAGR